MFVQPVSVPSLNINLPKETENDNSMSRLLSDHTTCTCVTLQNQVLWFITYAVLWFSSLVIYALGSLTSVLKPIQDKCWHQMKSRVHGLVSPAEKNSKQWITWPHSGHLHFEHLKTHVTRTDHMVVLGLIEWEASVISLCFRIIPPMKMCWEWRYNSMHL